MSVTASPVAGRATDHLVRFLAEEFGVAVKDIQVVFGRFNVNKHLSQIRLLLQRRPDRNRTEVNMPLLDRVQKKPRKDRKRNDSLGHIKYTPLVV